jgi:hypothetical protein
MAGHDELFCHSEVRNVRELIDGRLSVSTRLVIRGLDPPAGLKPFGVAKARVSIYLQKMGCRVKPGNDET